MNELETYAKLEYLTSPEGLGLASRAEIMAFLVEWYQRAKAERERKARMACY